MAKGGRPRKIKSVRQFEERAEAYFRECEAREEPVLLSSGLRWSTRRPCIPATRPGRSSP